MRRIALIGSLWCAGLAGMCQNEIDALRFSNTQVPGTARSLGMGGAFGALGADNSSFWINPAGVGIFRRSGLELTLGMSDQNARTSYMGESARDGRANLTIQSLGLNSTKKLEGSRWKSYNVGFAYGKHQNFNERIQIRGTAANTTLLDVFALQANGTAPADLMTEYPFGAGLAWESYAIDPLNPDELTYVAAAGSGEVLQEKKMDRKGAISETAFALGGNFDDWLFLGASASFYGINFTEEANYTERFFQTEDLSSFRLREDLRVTGSGLGVKLGAIASVATWLRLGLSWHSRVRYGLTDTYSAEMRSSFLNGDQEGIDSPINVSSYTLRAPGRIIASAAFLLGGAGVIAADYEFTDFASIRMSGTSLNPYDFARENETIKSIYRGTHRVRAGVEFRMAENWRVRFGSQYAQSPFIRGVNSNSPQLAYTAGGGFRYDAFFVDLAALYMQRTEDYYLYDPRMVSSASTQFSRLSFLISGGVRF